MDELERLRDENQMLTLEIEQLRVERETWEALPAVRADLVKKLEAEKVDAQVKIASIDARIGVLKKAK